MELSGVSLVGFNADAPTTLVLTAAILGAVTPVRTAVRSTTALGSREASADVVEDPSGGPAPWEPR